MDLTSYMPVKLITGADCVRKSAELIKSMGKRAFIVTGKHAAKLCGALSDVTDTLDVNGQVWTLFDGVGQNPKLSDCMSASQRAIEFNADFVIGIGGGSAQDAAKCVAILARNPGMSQEQLFAYDWVNAPLPIMLVGTTAGTGSEVTKVSVLSTPDGRKKSLHHEAIFAALSFGDPRYTLSLPEMTTRSTAVDILAHCVESYFTRGANELSQLYAVRGIRLLLPVFRKIAASDHFSLDYSDRETLYYASIYGGLAINITSTSFPHTVGYLLTESFSVPHGTACAVLHEAFYRHNKAVVPELTERFLREISSGEEEYLSLLSSVTPPCDITISEDVLRQAHSRWINNSSINRCHGEMTAEMVDNMLRERFGE